MHDCEVAVREWARAAQEWAVRSGLQTVHQVHACYRLQSPMLVRVSHE